MTWRTGKLVLMINAALTVTSGAAGGDLAITWSTIDGGGGVLATSNGLEVACTIGQTDSAAVLTMTGATLSLTGGFWAVAGAGVVVGDCDHDGQVTLRDYEEFALCVGGPDGITGPNCLCTDFDGDGDTDLRDFAALQRALEGL